MLLATTQCTPVDVKIENVFVVLLSIILSTNQKVKNYFQPLVNQFSSLLTFRLLPFSSGSSRKTNNHGKLTVNAMNQISITAILYCLKLKWAEIQIEFKFYFPSGNWIWFLCSTSSESYLDEIETYGHDMATHRSMEIAINVFTDADTDTPCIYETVLQMNVPSVHSVNRKIILIPRPM